MVPQGDLNLERYLELLRTLETKNKKLLILTFLDAQVWELRGFLATRFLEFADSTLAACFCSPRAMRNRIRAEILAWLPPGEEYWFKRMSCFSEYRLLGHSQSGWNWSWAPDKPRKEIWQKMRWTDYVHLEDLGADVSPYELIL